MFQRSAFAFVLASVLMPKAAFAECIVLTAKAVMAEPGIEVVFV